MTILFTLISGIAILIFAVLAVLFALWWTQNE
jgi:uncharacterized protein YggT (Ycf19 family)